MFIYVSYLKDRARYLSQGGGSAAGPDVGCRVVWGWLLGVIFERGSEASWKGLESPGGIWTRPQTTETLGQPYEDQAELEEHSPHIHISTQRNFSAWWPRTGRRIRHSAAI